MTLDTGIVLLAIAAVCVCVCAWIIVRVGAAYDKAAADMIDAYRAGLDRRVTAARAVPNLEQATPTAPPIHRVRAMTTLTPHFTLAELTASTTAAAHGLPNVPDAAATANLRTLAELLERVRAHLGVPITVTSGYRSVAVNFAVGGRPNSDHVSGLAADIVAPSYGTAHAVASALAPHVSTLGIGQLILEGVRGKQWVHISAKPPANAINRILTITDSGTVPGIVELA